MGGGSQGNRERRNSIQGPKQGRSQGNFDRRNSIQGPKQKNVPVDSKTTIQDRKSESFAIQNFIGEPNAPPDHFVETGFPRKDLQKVQIPLKSGMINKNLEQG